MKITEGKDEMASGVGAVRGEIIGAFRNIQIYENVDANSRLTILSFRTEGRTFGVRVSKEFDGDQTGTTAPINGLVDKLRGSPTGQITVTTTGIV
jgi:hypothetical protein